MAGPQGAFRSWLLGFLLIVQQVLKPNSDPSPWWCWVSTVCSVGEGRRGILSVHGHSDGAISVSEVVTGVLYVSMCRLNGWFRCFFGTQTYHFVNIRHSHPPCQCVWYSLPVGDYGVDPSSASLNLPFQPSSPWWQCEEREVKIKLELIELEVNV